MNKKDAVIRSRFTLRLNEDVDKKIAEKAKSLGISKNGYISMVLNKEVNKTG